MEKQKAKLISSIKQGNLKKLKETLGRVDLSSALSQEEKSDYICKVFKAAICKNDKAISQLLLTKFIKVRIGKGTWPLLIHAAVQTGEATSVVALLSKGNDINGIHRWKQTSGNFKGTVLHLAIRERQLEIAELLVKRGADVNAKGELDETPLHMAVRNQYLPSVQLLVNKGAAVNSTANNNVTPLDVAARGGHLGIVRYLLEKGATVNQVLSIKAQSPLHNAIRKNHQEIVKLLIDKGANVNAQDFYHDTPLHVAVANDSCSEIVEYLLKRGSNVMASDIDGNTPIYIAAENGCCKNTLILLNNGADINSKCHNGLTSLHTALRFRKIGVVNLLLKHGADCSAVDSEGATPLHYSARYGYCEIIESLLNLGVDINCRDHEGATPLYHASCLKMYKFAVMTLLENGADINILLNDGTSSLTVLSVFDEDNYSWEIVEIFVKFIVKMLSLNQFVHDSYLNLIRRTSKLRALKVLCEKEIEELKKDEISGTAVSLYDVLTKNLDFLEAYARNENIVNAVNSNDFDENYPLYASFIRRQLNRGTVRKELLEKNNRFFRALFPQLPDICNENIFLHLNNRDLSILLEARKPQTS